MSAPPLQDDTKRLAAAITDFLRSQCSNREDLSPEDRESLLVAMECLESVYEVGGADLFGLQVSRPLLEIFVQAARPVKVKHRLEAETLKNLGNENVATGNCEAAEEAYTAAIALDKWNAVYYCNRAAARIRLQKFSQAISDCRQAIELSPDYAKAHAKMGQAYVMMETPRRAVRCFRQASQLEPDNEAYRTNLRVAESQSGGGGGGNGPHDPTGGLESLIEQLLGVGGAPGTTTRITIRSPRNAPGACNDAREFFDLGSNLMRMVLTDVASTTVRSTSSSGSEGAVEGEATSPGVVGEDRKVVGEDRKVVGKDRAEATPLPLSGSGSAGALPAASSGTTPKKEEQKKTPSAEKPTEGDDQNSSKKPDVKPDKKDDEPSPGT